MNATNKQFIPAICIALAVCLSLATAAASAPAAGSVEAEGQGFSTEKSAIITNQSNPVKLNDPVGPRRDDPGDILATFNMPAPFARTYGLAWDPDRALMWGWSQNAARLYAIDPANWDGEPVADFQGPGGGAAGLFYLDGELWLGGYGNARTTIFRFDTDGNALEPWRLPLDPNVPIYGVASNGNQIFVLPDDGVRILVIDRVSRELIATIDRRDALGRADVRSIEWVSTHPRGQLWFGGDASRLYQVSVDREWGIAHVQDFPMPAGTYLGLAHDGENMWAAPDSGVRWYVVDDGNEEVELSDWLSYEPVEFDVEAEGQQEVTVTINGEEMVEGDYEADLIFATNDPENREVVTSIFIRIVGAPDITVAWPEAVGYPDVVDWNAAHADLFTGVPYDVTVQVTNSGMAELEIANIASADQRFTANPVELALESDQSADVTLTFLSDESGDFQAVMVFTSNDPDNGEFEVALHAHAIVPPQVRIEPNAIEEELFSGAVEEYPIMVFNDGEALLHVVVNHEIIQEPGQDVVGRRGRQLRRSTAERRDNPNSPLFK